jgi:NADH:ubiquinone oxidoreductase subunit 4 (subunit M)
MNLRVNFLYFFLIFFFFSIIYVLILCFFINDLKLIIAYFSISHIALVILILFLNRFFSLNFRIIIILAHSISSPILFFFSIILYKNFRSRIIIKISRIFNIKNLYSWLFFIFLIFNISVPPSLNFFREILIFIFCLKYYFVSFISIIILILFSGLISIFLILKLILIKEKIFSSYIIRLEINLTMIFFIFFLFAFILLIFLKNF